MVWAANGLKKNKACPPILCPKIGSQRRPSASVAKRHWNLPKWSVPQARRRFQQISMIFCYQRTASFGLQFLVAKLDVMGYHGALFFSQFATRFEIIIFILMYSVLILNVMSVLYIHTIESELKKNYTCIIEQT